MTHAQVLDVRGIAGKPARIREIRAMAGRAMLDGPHTYQTRELEGPLLDLAVSKAAGLKAVIHLVDNAIAPFYECCVLCESGRLHYQYLPSRSWHQGGPIVESEKLMLEPLLVNGDWYGDWRSVCLSWEGRTHSDAQGDSPLVAAMRCYVLSTLGETVRM
jgi:hypothetical protein